MYRPLVVCVVFFDISYFGFFSFGTSEDAKRGVSTSASTHLPPERRCAWVLSISVGSTVADA